LPDSTCGEGAVTALIRPDAVTPNSTGLQVDGTLTGRSFRGRHTRITVRANEINLEFELDSAATLPPVGSAIRLALRPDAIDCLPA